MTDHFVDTSVFLMAVGGAHAQRDDSRGFLEAAAAGGDRLHTSVETIQEFVFHRMRRTDRARAVSAARALSDSCVLHTFDDEVLAVALRLIDETQIRGRDAVHAATALTAGFGSIVSLDPDFDQMPGLARIHPSAAR